MQWGLWALTLCFLTEASWFPLVGAQTVKFNGKSALKLGYLYRDTDWWRHNPANCAHIHRRKIACGALWPRAVEKLVTSDISTRFILIVDDSTAAWIFGQQALLLIQNYWELNFFFSTNRNYQKIRPQVRPAIGRRFWDPRFCEKVHDTHYG